MYKILLYKQKNKAISNWIALFDIVIKYDYTNIKVQY